MRCDFNRSTGAFSAEVWSTLQPDLWYTLRTDWLLPGQETEPSEERARGYCEWGQRIYPDAGGNVGDLVDQFFGIGLVYAWYDAPRRDKFNQLHLNTTSQWLYQREVVWR